MGVICWIILRLIAGFIGSKIAGKQGQGFVAQHRIWFTTGLKSGQVASCDTLRFEQM